MLFLYQRSVAFVSRYSQCYRRGRLQIAKHVVQLEELTAFYARDAAEKTGRINEYATAAEIGCAV